MSLSIGMLVKMPRSDEENDQSRMNFTKNLRTVSTPAAVVLSTCSETLSVMCKITAKTTQLIPYKNFIFI